MKAQNETASSELFVQINMQMATGRISQWNKTQSIKTIIFNFCEDNGHNKAMPCEMSNADIAMVTIAAQLQHAEEKKAYTKCLMNMA